MKFFSNIKLLHNVPVTGELPGENQIFKKTIRVAWPSILESFLVGLVGMIDTIMVSVLGTYAIAAVGLTNQPKFIGLAVFLSLNVAISAIVAHRFGEQDRGKANRVLVQALLITVGLAALLSVICLVFADPIIHFAGSAPDTHHDAVLYFRIIMGCMVFNVLSMVINAAQRGAGNTKVAMRTNLISNLVNLVFNYLLIGGNFGFPKLGVAGAAIATVIGTIVACVMSFFSLMHRDQFLCLMDVGRFRFDKESLKSILNIGSSTFAEQIFLRFGFLVYAVVVANLGTAAFAAHQIGMNIITISFSFGDGLSVAAVALVGQSLGEQRKDLSKIYGSACQRIGLIFAVFLSIVFLTLGRLIFMLFSTEPEVLQYSTMIMAILAGVVFFQIPQVIYSGCLRGAGDTKYTAFVSLISVALIRPLSGYLLCYPFGLGLFGAWLGLFVDQFLRFSLTGLRFKSGKWMHFKV